MESCIHNLKLMTDQGEHFLIIELTQIINDSIKVVELIHPLNVKNIYDLHIYNHMFLRFKYRALIFPNIKGLYVKNDFEFSLEINIYERLVFFYNMILSACNS